MPALSIVHGSTLLNDVSGALGQKWQFPGAVSLSTLPDVRQDVHARRAVRIPFGFDTSLRHEITKFRLASDKDTVACEDGRSNWHGANVSKASRIVETDTLDCL